MTTAVNGFRKTGIWLLDPTVFTDDNFLPAETTNILADTQIMAATASDSSCDHTQAECPTQTPQFTTTFLAHLETFMRVNLLQRWLKTLHKPVHSTKFLLQRFYKYHTLANQV
jgi:hypothetical protein